MKVRNASQLLNGEQSEILGIDYNHPSARRIIEVGFTPGEEIKVIGKSLFDDPIAFSIRGTVIAIRKSEASSIIIR